MHAGNFLFGTETRGAGTRLGEEGGGQRAKGGWQGRGGVGGEEEGEGVVNGVVGGHVRDRSCLYYLAGGQAEWSLDWNLYLSREASSSFGSCLDPVNGCDV